MTRGTLAIGRAIAKIADRAYLSNVRLELSLVEDYGTHLSDGSKALEYRRVRIDPYLLICSKIVVDFTGIRHGNSSFVNALIAGVLAEHGEAALEKLIFKGCNPVIRVLVEAAIDLGLQQNDECVVA